MSHLDSLSLCCVISGQRLRRVDRQEFTRRGDPTLVGLGNNAPIGLTKELMVTQNDLIGYPIVDGVPVVLAPEAFSFDSAVTRSVSDRRYAEAYAEREHYGQSFDISTNDIDTSSAWREVQPVFERVTPESARSFPDPPELWLSSNSTASARHGALSFLGDLKDTNVLQIGGGGTHALLMLIAGAKQAVTISPMPRELAMGVSIARRLGFENRFFAVCAVAEEIPLESGTIDRAYSGGSMHHTWTDKSFPEIARVLTSSGRFASVDVFAAPLHGIGTRIFGKAEKGVNCEPMDRNRISPAYAFFRLVEETYHGALARYPLAVAQRMGVTPTPAMAWRLARWEDSIAARYPLIERQASLVSVRCAQPVA